MKNEKKPPGGNHRARRKRVRKSFERLHKQPVYWDHGILYFFWSRLPVPEAPEIRKIDSGHVHAAHERKITPTLGKHIHISQFDRERGSQPRHWFDK